LRLQRVRLAVIHHHDGNPVQYIQRHANALVLLHDGPAKARSALSRLSRRHADHEVEAYAFAVEIGITHHLGSEQIEFDGLPRRAQWIRTCSSPWAPCLGETSLCGGVIGEVRLTEHPAPGGKRVLTPRHAHVSHRQVHARGGRTMAKSAAALVAPSKLANGQSSSVADNSRPVSPCNSGRPVSFQQLNALQTAVDRVFRALWKMI